MKGQSVEEKDTERKWVARNFPRHTLEESLEVAQAIQDKNAGKPMKRIFVADAINRTPASSEFKYLLSSSFKYGLTVGTEKSDIIGLTPVGQALTKPKSSEERLKALQQAVMFPEVFKRVYEHYKDAKLPTDDFFKNVLEREFGVPRERVEECRDMILENGNFAKIIKDVSGSPYIIVDGGSGSEHSTEERVDITTPAHEEARKPELPAASKPIFVGHGKNTKPLGQLTAIFDQFGIPHKVAIYEPNQGRPISEKVAELMKSCGSAIFIITADEVTEGEDGKLSRPSGNVIYELGAATFQYGKKIIVFKEDGVTLPSDFSNLCYIPFDASGGINMKVPELMKELVGLGLVRIMPG